MAKNKDLEAKLRELSPATRKRGHETKSNVGLTFIKVRDSGKSIFEVLEWYNDIINFFIDYISLSIHDSDISEFYRYIIGFKNLLRWANSLIFLLSRK